MIEPHSGETKLLYTYPYLSKSLHENFFLLYISWSKNTLVNQDIFIWYFFFISVYTFYIIFSISIKRTSFLRNRKLKLFDNGKHNRTTSQIRNRTPVSNYKMIYKFSNHIELVQQLNKGGITFNVLKRVTSRIYKKEFNFNRRKFVVSNND